MQVVGVWPLRVLDDKEATARSQLAAEDATQLSEEFMEGRYTHAVVIIPPTLADTPTSTPTLRWMSAPP